MENTGSSINCKAKHDFVMTYKNVLLDPTPPFHQRPIAARVLMFTSSVTLFIKTDILCHCGCLVLIDIGTYGQAHRFWRDTCYFVEAAKKESCFSGLAISLSHFNFRECRKKRVIITGNITRKNSLSMTFFCLSSEKSKSKSCQERAGVLLSSAIASFRGAHGHFRGKIHLTRCSTSTIYEN